MVFAPLIQGRGNCPARDLLIFALNHPIIMRESRAVCTRGIFSQFKACRHAGQATGRLPLNVAGRLTQQGKNKPAKQHSDNLKAAVRLP
jgi:hypothetical protein